VVYQLQDNILIVSEVLGFLNVSFQGTKLQFGKIREKN